MKTFLTTLKIACFAAVLILIVGNCLLEQWVIAGVLVFTCGLPLAKSLGDELGTRWAKRDIADVRAEVTAGK